MEANRKRMTNDELRTKLLYAAGTDTSSSTANFFKVQQKFYDELYSLEQSFLKNTEKKPIVMDFKPTMSFLCIKNLSVQRLTEDMYNKLKARRLNMEDHIQSQSLAVIHFNPENILKRMNFRWARQSSTPTDVNSTED